MKKIILIMLLAFIMVATNCYAENAYSIGTKWGNDTYKPGLDHRQNAINAANAYHNLSGFNSYYSTEPTYSYIKSKSRLGGSSVFFINGHASGERIRVASKNAENYQTGISVKKDGYTINNATEGYWIFAGLEGRDMSKTKLITFVGCNTAQGTNNLVKKSVEQGAKSAVGFLRTITSTELKDTHWLSLYNQKLGAGSNVMSAIIAANEGYSDSTLAKNYFLSGKGSTTLGTPKKSKLVDSNRLLNDVLKEDLDFKEKNIHILVEDAEEKSVIEPAQYLKLKFDEKLNSPVFQTKRMNQAQNEIDIPLNSISKNVELTKIIEVIKRYDSSFDEEDYKLSYNFSDTVENFGTIFLDYYINGIIQTNKTYMIVTVNNKIQSITLAGVKKENLNNINLINNEEEISKVRDFEKDKKAKKIIENETKYFKSTKLLNKDKSINLNNLEDNIKDIKEGYFYDFNSNELFYKALLTIEEDGLFDGQSINIKID